MRLPARGDVTSILERSAFDVAEGGAVAPFGADLLGALGLAGFAAGVAGLMALFGARASAAFRSYPSG